MLKQLIITVMICASLQLAAQDQISFHLGQAYAKFKFTNSEGKVDSDVFTEIRYTYGINYSTPLNSFINFNGELGYKNWGANSILNNQKVNWDLHYADVNLGFVSYFTKGKFRPYLGVNWYYSTMFKGEQTIGVTYYDLMNSNDLKFRDYGLILKGGAHYSFTEAAGIFVEYRHHIGLRNLEQDANQQWLNRAYSIHFGWSFLIPQGTLKSNPLQ